MQLTIATVSAGLILSGCAGVLQAQHRGGGAAPVGGHPSAQGHVLSPMRAVPPTPPAPIGLGAPGAGFTGITPGVYNSGAYRSGGHLPNGYGWVNTGRQTNNRQGNTGNNSRRSNATYLPFYSILTTYGSGFDSGPSSYEQQPAPYDAAAADAQVTANVLGDQVDRLSAEVEDLRNAQQAQRPPMYLAASPANDPPAPPAPPLTLVLTNGQRLEVTSYAVMDGTLWDFSKAAARKIPVANINVDASAKATEANGGEFPTASFGK